MNDSEEIQQIIFSHGFDSIEHLGNGSTSNVFLCHSKRYNDFFSIKRVAKNSITELEYNALVSLDSPYIIKLYDAFEYGNYQYLVMEYCSNGTLKQKGKLDKSTFIQYSKQILEALLTCHNNLIAHRDLKPENIFIDKYNRIKLADFGFARQFNSIQTSNEKCGSLMYAAPEIFTSKNFDPFRTDIWSLGLAFYYMITGELPYQCSLDELRIAVIQGKINYGKIMDNSIRSLITRMTSKIPENRPSIASLLQHPVYNQVKPKIMKNSISYFSLNFYKTSNVIYQTPKFPSKTTSEYSSNESVSSDEPEVSSKSILKVHTYSSLIRLPQVKTKHRV